MGKRFTGNQEVEKSLSTLQENLESRLYLCHRQSLDPSHSRDVGNRKGLSEERWRVSDAKERKNKIGSWASLIAYCNSLDSNIVSSDESLRLCKLSDDTFPPGNFCCEDKEMLQRRSVSWFNLHSVD